MREITAKREEETAKHQAALLGLPYVHLIGRAIPGDILALIPESQARSAQAIPFHKQSNELWVATTTAPVSASHGQIQEDLKKHHYLTTQWYFTSVESFNRSVLLYQTLPTFHPETSGVSISPEELEQWKTLTTLQQIKDKLEGLPITEMLNLIIAGALNTRSSDIHIEAEENDVKLRYRIDGVLVDITQLPKEVWNRLIARLKLLAGLKLNITDKPQDGRFRIELPGSKEAKVDVRVSTLPTNFGESIVIRLLGSSLVGEITFETMGLRGNPLEELRKQIQRPNGMIITTGPTGSGKTTTMYGILTILNEPGVKIITIEDPIEYELKGITQSQIDTEKNYTFANGLKSIVRQDPDIILVGEIRDTETTEIAIQAALTGHLVLSTVHTNSAAGTIPRLVALGAKPFLLAPAVNAMIGQRLVRKLCDACKKPTELPGELLQRVQTLLGAISPASGITVDTTVLKFFAAVGCEACHGIGYKGRLGIFEIMVMTKDIEKIIHDGSASEIDLEELAIKQGMITMAQDGLLKAAEGLTSVDEVFRVAE